MREKAGKRSLKDDASRLKVLTKHIGPDRPLAEITTPFASKLMQEITESPSQRRARLAPATLAQYATLLQGVMKLASQFGYVDAAPQVRRPTVKNERDMWLTKEQAQRLISELPPYLAAPAMFSLQTGLRAGNVSNLKWRHINMERRVLTVPADEMKTGKVHSIPLNEKALDVLRSVSADVGLVFTKDGKQIVQFSNRDFRAACRRAGVEGLRWHDLRHTHFSWLVQSGVPLEVVKRLGGWSSYDLVLRYAHHAHEDLANAVSRL